MSSMDTISIISNMPLDCHASDVTNSRISGNRPTISDAVVVRLTAFASVRMRRARAFSRGRVVPVARQQAGNRQAHGFEQRLGRLTQGKPAVLAKMIRRLPGGPDPGRQYRPGTLRQHSDGHRQQCCSGKAREACPPGLPTPRRLPCGRNPPGFRRTPGVRQRKPHVASPWAPCRWARKTFPALTNTTPTPTSGLSACILTAAV